MLYTNIQNKKKTAKLNENAIYKVITVPPSKCCHTFGALREIYSSPWNYKGFVNTKTCNDTDRTL